MSSVLTSVFAVFTAVGDWISTAITAFIPIFYDSTEGLTFLGVLACCGLAFSTCLLIISIIQRFLRFG